MIDSSQVNWIIFAALIPRFLFYFLLCLKTIDGMGLGD